MPAFRYKALASSGEVLEGTIEAQSTEEAVAKLQEQGHLPIDAKPAEAGGGGGLRQLFQPRGVSGDQIARFTQQLATLLGAGMPLDRALGIQVELAETDKLRRLLDAIRERVRGGSSLSDALEAQHGVFSRLYVNLVRAGELGGTLDQTLARLADYLQRSKNLKDQVISALIYPVILLLLAAGALIFLLTFVMPRMVPLFEQLGAELPLITRIVMGFAWVLRYGWWVLVLAALGSYWYFQSQYADPDGRLRWDQRWLGLRGVGDLLLKLDTARLARTAGTLLKNGVPLLSALAIAKNVLGNSALAAAVEEASKQVKTGGGLAHALGSTKRFPKLALQMITVGEETGQLDEMLLKVAEVYDQEVRTTVDRLMALLVPVLTIALAGFIAIIVVSMVMAILSANELFA